MSKYRPIIWTELVFIFLPGSDRNCRNRNRLEDHLGAVPNRFCAMPMSALVCRLEKPAFPIGMLRHGFAQQLISIIVICIKHIIPRLGLLINKRTASQIGWPKNSSKLPWFTKITTHLVPVYFCDVKLLETFLFSRNFTS